jgi:ferredoxin
MGDDGFAKGGNIPAHLLEDARQARDGCPVDAIDVVE